MINAFRYLNRIGSYCFEDFMSFRILLFIFFESTPTYEETIGSFNLRRSFYFPESITINRAI